MGNLGLGETLVQRLETAWVKTQLLSPLKFPSQGNWSNPGFEPKTSCKEDEVMIK